MYVLIYSTLTSRTFFRYKLETTSARSNWWVFNSEQSYQRLSRRQHKNGRRRLLNLPGGKVFLKSLVNIGGYLGSSRANLWTQWLFLKILWQRISFYRICHSLLLLIDLFDKWGSIREDDREKERIQHCFKGRKVWADVDSFSSYWIHYYVCVFYDYNGLFRILHESTGYSQCCFGGYGM